jgi:dihydrodipicolinate synthase/N-acetylneuraminate lyase
MEWKGVMPAMTTAFDDNLNVDHDFMAKHALWLIENGCSGLVVLGSLGESTTLTPEEKRSILKSVRSAVPKTVPVVAAIAGLSTFEVVALAKYAADLGCDGLMVLPPYVYQGDWREMGEHMSAVFRATSLPCMLYNNPVAYGRDFVPQQIRELAQAHENLVAVKESSADVRRVTAIRELCGDRLRIFVGVDDLIVEGIAAGAVGWIAGLVNALPKESVALFNLVSAGDQQKTFDLYRWFLPLLRMDTVPKFVQLIKLVQEEVDMGSSRVRPPRLALTGKELEQEIRIIRRALQERPQSESDGVAVLSR